MSLPVWQRKKDWVIRGHSLWKNMWHSAASRKGRAVLYKASTDHVPYLLVMLSAAPRFHGRPREPEARSRGILLVHTRRMFLHPIENAYQGDRDILFDTPGKQTYTTCAGETGSRLWRLTSSATTAQVRLFADFPPSQNGIPENDIS